MKRLLLSAVLMTLTTAASAQWSENSEENNRVTPVNVTFYDPVVLTNADGVSYFFTVVPAHTADGHDGFQYRLQILDADGRRVYGAAGKVIAHERNTTWTKFNDYIVLDHEGNCIVSCFDMRDSAPDASDFNYFIYKVTPTGDVAWGPVALNGGVCDVNMTGLTMCATDDGGTALAYVTTTGTEPAHAVTHLERISADGELLWQQPVVVEPSQTTSRPLVVSNGQNEVMLLYQDATGQYVARVFDADGNDVWGESVVVYSGGFSSDRVYPSMNVQSGPDGGVLFSVMDGGWDGRIIWMDREGSYGFPTANIGTMVAGSSYQSTVPSVLYDAEEQAFYAAFNNMDTYGYAGYGVNIQKFSLQGTRQWGDDGVSILPTQEGQQVSGVTVRSAGSGRVAVFYQYMGSKASNDPVETYMTLVDRDGNIVLESQNLTTSAYVKNDFAVSPLIAGNHYILSWTERRSGSTSSCLYAQYVNVDGGTSNGISSMAATATAPAAVFSPGGVRRQTPGKGLNIIRRQGKVIKQILY